MNRDTIAREIEAYSDPADRPLLLAALGACQYGSEWQALVGVEWIRYGVRSYECHRKWVPSGLLRRLMAIRDDS